MNNPLIKAPPSNILAEQAILGGILINNEALEQVQTILSSDCFYREAHQHLYQGMFDLYDQDKTIDLFTLSEHLRQKDLLEKAGGSDYIVSLMDAVSTSAGIVHHAEIIRDLATKRGVLVDCSALCESCLQDWQDKDEILSTLDHISTKYNDIQIKSDIVPLGDAVKAAFKQLENNSECESGITGLSTGYTDFDRLTAGLQPSDLIIIAGRPSMGKTAMAMNIVKNVAEKRGISLVFSLEMSRLQLAMRYLGSDAQVNTILLRSGRLKNNQWSSLSDSAGHLSGLPIYIDDTSGISVQDMKYKARKLKKAKGLSLIVVDYLQLATIKGRSESKQIEISEISRSLKGIAKDLNVPVIALSQLNRKVEDRPNKRPHLNDLRESGAIEQDADVIAFIYRDEVYNPTTDENRNIAEIIIEKHRNGPTGLFKLTFQKEFTQFRDYVSEDYYPQYSERFDQRY